MKIENPQIRETFSVKTKYGIVKEVPMIRWKELVPYWAAICRAIFEVLIENDFHPYTATLKRPIFSSLLFHRIEILIYYFNYMKFYEKTNERISA